MEHGSVLSLDLVALARVKELKRKKEQKSHAHASDNVSEKAKVSNGTKQSRRAHQSDRKQRRSQEKIGGRLRARECRIVERTVMALVNPSGGGTAPGITSTPSVIQRWRQLNAVRECTGKKKGKQPACNDAATHEWVSLGENQQKRKIDDGILFVVNATIFGHTVRTLIDSGATRSFISSEAVLPLGLKCTSQDTMLELGNGMKVLSRGKILDVPVVTAGLSMKLDLTVTKLLHNVDVVLGINWLQTVNPIIDWRGSRMFIPESLGVSWLAGHWLGSDERVGTVQVLSDTAELEKLKIQKELTTRISVLTNPQFWMYTGGVQATWNIMNEGHKKNEEKEQKGKLNDGERGYCTDCQCKLSLCTKHCKMNSDDIVQDSNIVTDRVSDEKEKEMSGQKGTEYEEKKGSKKECRKVLTRVQGKPVLQRKNNLQKQRQILSAKQLKKLMKRKEPAFLAIVRAVGKNERRPAPEHGSLAAVDTMSHGITEKVKREHMRAVGPKKSFLTVEERKEEIFQKVAPEFRETLRGIVNEYKEVFPDKLPKGRPPKRDVEHHIETVPGVEPPSRPPYRLGPAEQDEMEAQIKDLLEQGFIRPSASPYGAPILFVPKKDGRWRMCMDYRALNKQTVKDRFPLPRIDQLIDRLGKAKVFSKLDLASGYHQIAVAEDSIYKTAFRTTLGHWEFIVMPFGLTNAPASFQRLMNSVFQQEMNVFVLVYLDDILIFSNSLEEHWEHLRVALQRLKEAKLYGRLHKCEFLKDRIEYLGFDISAEGVHTSPEKVKAVVEWPTPSTVKDIRSFLGLASYYRKFIRGFSELARPLTNLTKKDCVWRWDEEEELAFLKLKTALATAPVLQLPDFELPFVLTTDASSAAVGAILEQDQGKGLRPVAFASRKLNNAESRYSAYERELLGIVWAIAQWRHYFHNTHPIVVQTDHAPLRHLPNQASVNSRIWKWMNILQGYNLDMRHIPGKKNPADSLSRQHLEEACKQRQEVKEEESELVNVLRIKPHATNDDIQNALTKIFARESEPIVQSVQVQDQDRNQFNSDQFSQTEQEQEIETVSEQSETQAKLLVHQSVVRVEDQLKQQIQTVLSSEYPYSEILTELQNQREIERGNEKFRIQHGLLVRHQTGRTSDDESFWRIVVPDDQNIKFTIMNEMHSTPYAGHPGFQRTLAKIRKNFYWKGMTGDVQTYVLSCPACQLEKAEHTLVRGQLQPIQLPEEKWREVSLDFVTDLPESATGDNAILNVIDRATRMVHCIPCKKTITAAQTAKLYWRHVGKLHGVPKILYSDRGSVFTGDFWRTLWATLGTQLHFSTAYHPQTQGVIEKMNQLVSQTLRCIIHQLGDVSEWKAHLATVEFAINSLPNRSTGYSPFYLNYGYHPVVPSELIKGDEDVKNEAVLGFVNRLRTVWIQAKQNLEQSVAQQKKYYDKRHRAVHFDVGQYVLLSTANLRMKHVPSKLQRKFVGPFKIVERIGVLAYRLALPVHWRVHNVFHISLLRPWNQSVYTAQQQQVVPELEDATPEYHEVEKILRWRRVKKGNRWAKEYMVMWTGRPIDEISWVPEENFPNKRSLRDDIEHDQPIEVDPLSHPMT